MKIEPDIIIERLSDNLSSWSDELETATSPHCKIKNLLKLNYCDTELEGNSSIIKRVITKAYE